MAAHAEVSLPAGFIRTVAEARTRQQVLDATSTWIPHIIEAERSSIAIPLDDTALVINAIGGTNAIMGGTILPIVGSMVGQVFSSGELLVVGDLSQSNAAEAHVLQQAGLQSALIAPLLSHGRCLGTINLGNYEPWFFTQHHCDLLRSVALLIASFLHVHDMAEAATAAANSDDLTSVLARTAVLKRLEDGFSAGAGRSLDLLYIDLDGFKTVNDSHGHRVGDRVLQIITERINNQLTEGETVGRIGGDEFLIVVEGKSAERAQELGRSILESCMNTIVVGNIRISPRLSIGIASRVESTPSASYLLGTADQAMYTAKASDKHLVVADSEIRQQVAMIMTLDRELDAAMANGGMHFNYQPVRDAVTGEVLGAEALLRWTHPIYGAISPPLIVERIEGTGRISQFTEWTLRTAARDLASVRRRVPRFADKAFAINLTPHQLAWDRYCEVHEQTCEEFGIRMQDLIIEVVEIEGIEPGDAAEKNLCQIANSGGVIALDDFGAGHNGLRYFARFPIHALKFDRSLISATVHNPMAQTILKSLSAMSDELGIMALAEGVETEAEHKMCVKAGIRHGQGWFFGRPMPLADYTDLVRSELSDSVLEAQPSVAEQPS